LATFDFDLNTDTAEGVAREMAKELKIGKEFQLAIEKKISGIVNQI
jgi:hypothetical protein